MVLTKGSFKNCQTRARPKRNAFDNLQIYFSERNIISSWALTFWAINCLERPGEKASDMAQMHNAAN